VKDRFSVPGVLMQVVILAGGKGTRINEESTLRPKPMIELGGIPIIVHIMRYFSHFGHNDFIICAGYKSRMIKEFFNNYYVYMIDATFDMRSNNVTWHHEECEIEPWRVTVVDTGLETMTGGRLQRIRRFLNDEPFFMTYGDGLAVVDLTAIADAYRKSGCSAMVTAVQPPGRFGRFAIADGKITGFIEKPRGDGDWINGGYFLMHPSVLERVEGDDSVWEREPMESLAAEGQLVPFFHRGFWQPMDTLRDKLYLESVWESGNAPWKK
jgi:glucose-1-phosphate cytidylyltransferase